MFPSRKQQADAIKGVFICRVTHVQRFGSHVPDRDVLVAIGGGHNNVVGVKRDGPYANYQLTAPHLASQALGRNLRRITRVDAAKKDASKKDKEHQEVITSVKEKYGSDLDIRMDVIDNQAYIVMGNNKVAFSKNKAWKDQVEFMLRAAPEMQRRIETAASAGKAATLALDDIIRFIGGIVLARTDSESESDNGEDEDDSEAEVVLEEDEVMPEVGMVEPKDDGTPVAECNTAIVAYRKVGELHLGIDGDALANIHLKLNNAFDGASLEDGDLIVDHFNDTRKVKEAKSATLMLAHLKVALEVSCGYSTGSIERAGGYANFMVLPDEGAKKRVHTLCAPPHGKAVIHKATDIVQNIHSAYKGAEANGAYDNLLSTCVELRADIMELIKALDDDTFKVYMDCVQTNTCALDTCTDAHGNLLTLEGPEAKEYGTTIEDCDAGSEYEDGIFDDATPDELFDILTRVWPKVKDRFPGGAGRKRMDECIVQGSVDDAIMHLDEMRGDDDDDVQAWLELFKEEAAAVPVSGLFASDDEEEDFVTQKEDVQLLSVFTAKWAAVRGLHENPEVLVQMDVAGRGISIVAHDKPSGSTADNVREVKVFMEDTDDGCDGWKRKVRDAVRSSM